MATTIIDSSDLSSIAGTLSARELNDLADDLNTVLLAELPCLATLSELDKDVTRARLRLALRGRLVDAPQTVSRTRGPFSETIGYGPGRRAAILETVRRDLIPQLAGLCTAVRVYEHGMYSLPIALPEVY